MLNFKAYLSMTIILPRALNADGIQREVGCFSWAFVFDLEVTGQAGWLCLILFGGIIPVFLFKLAAWHQELQAPKDSMF